MLEASELVEIQENMESNKRSIPVDIRIYKVAFNKKASNQLLEHGASDMKIEFKEGQEPRNMCFATYISNGIG